jgi:glycosyltransferase involved in cell wall biosynthesis
LNLETLVRDLNLGARVEFCGHIDNAELEKALAGAAILVLPTAENLHQAEQFGKAALEGISCGLPVLASRTGNLAVLAQSLPTLAAFDLDSAEQMADAVRSIWNNFPSPEKLETARIQVQKTFGPLAATHNMEKVFASLLPDGRPS